MESTTATDQEQLRKIGLRTPIGAVTAAVAHLSKGESLYSLYNGSNPIGVSKKTAQKIKRLWVEDKLNFLLARVQAATVIPRIFPAIGETDEAQHAREDREKTEQAEESADYLQGLAWQQLPREQEDNLGHARMAWIRQVEDLVAEAKWTVAGLEKVGMPAGMVLSILVEYDKLHVHRVEAEVVSGPPTERWMRKFRDLKRYIELHYLVALQRQCPSAPFDLVAIAAELYCKGVMETNNRYLMAGEDIIRYEVWRGADYFDAYTASLKRLYRNKRASARLMTQIQDALSVVENS